MLGVDVSGPMLEQARSVINRFSIGRLMRQPWISAVFLICFFALWRHVFQ